jgi:hypothetical protein
MRAREFVREDADGQQVLDYIHGTHHEPLTKQLQQAVLSQPRWELRSVPVSSLHIPDQEYDDEEQEPETDPYNRVQAIDPDHASEYSANFVDRRPIVVDREGWIIDGNHRAWAAAELLNRSTIRAWVPVKQSVKEAFDQPYDIRWSKGDHGDYDAYADLDDGTGLEIAFLDQQHNSWMVDFFRDNSTEITGEGDAYRVFATVLTAIREFIVKQQPDKLNFSAEKQDDPRGSRASLYDRMIQRYISGTGYALTRQDHPDGATYTLTRTQQDVDEGLKSKLAGAALAGGMALGAGGANAMDWKDAAMTGAMFVPGIGQVAKAYNVGSSLWDAAKAAKQYKDLGKEIDALAAQQKALPKQTSTVTYDPKNADKFEPVDENFADGKGKGTELKNSIPTGLYFEIDDVRVGQLYQGLGIGALLYKLVVTCIARLNPKVKGLLSPRKNRLSTAANVSKIYSQLGGKININGAKDTYDLLPIKNYITLEVEPQPGAQIAAISGKNISFLVDEAGPYRVVLTVFDHNTMKPIGFISATAFFWDSETETLNNDNITENFADGRNPQDKGDSKRYGVPTKASVSTLRKVAKQGGRKGQLAHWMANMKAGRAKARKK